MLTVLLKVLSIVGILLLVLLGAALTAVLLALFFPVTYKLKGERRFAEVSAGAAEAGGQAGAAEGAAPVFQMSGWVKVNWLFGLLRVRFFYPEPGRLTVKALFFTLFDSSREGEQKEEKDKPQKRSRQPKRQEQVNTSDQPADGTAGKEKTAQTVPQDAPETKEAGQAQKDGAGQGAGSDAETKESLPEKIECTIHKLCDKIKEIRENIDFYKELLLCDDTKGLVNHAFRRLGKILRSIRPRKLSADILFGAGSPDTTGYALGVYGILSPHLGGRVNITPDFTRAVLAGELYAAGHITVFQLLRHGVMLLLDRRLHGLLQKWKARKTAADREKENREAADQSGK